MIKTINHALKLEHEYHIKNELEQKRIYLLLHGYQLDGSYMFRTFESKLQGRVVSPNGPFLIPTLKDNHYVPKYSWYFFDSETKKYLIDMRPAAEYLSYTMQLTNPEKWPITIIGYSQGGYLAPKIAEVIPEVDIVIGMACIFRSNLFERRNDVTYHQIHCQDDTIVNYQDSLIEFKKLSSNNGEFITLSGCGHRISKPYMQAISNLVTSKK